MFLIISIIYRPVEQLLSRTISHRRAQGLHSGHPLRTAITIQAVFAAVFLVIALAERERITDEVFDGSSELYWVLVVGVVAYAASYFARGWLAGHSRFGLYGGLVLLESVSRCLFALAVVLGIAEGQGVVALGIAAAPLVSLMVVPWALRGRDPAPPPDDVETPGGLGSHTKLRRRRAGDHGRRAGAAQRAGGDHGRHGHRRRAGGLRVQRAADHARAAAALPGDPDLAAPAPVGAGRDRQRRRHPARAAHHDPRHRRLRYRSGDRARRDRAVGDGPPVRRGLRVRALGLVLVGLGMGFHLAAGTLNQAALARDRAGLAAATWLGGAALFLLWLYGTPLDDQLLAVEAGYCATTALLCGVLWQIERRA